MSNILFHNGFQIFCMCFFQKGLWIPEKRENLCGSPRPAMEGVMTKRQLVWVVIAVSLALAVGLTVWFSPRPIPAGRSNFEKIEVGMTRAEVEEILGGSPVSTSPVP